MTAAATCTGPHGKAFPPSGGELAWLEGFCQETVEIAVGGSSGGDRLGATRRENHRDPGTETSQSLQGLAPVDAGHREIQKNEIDLVAVKLDLFHSAPAVADGSDLVTV